MKRSKIEQVVAEMQAEKVIVDACIVDVESVVKDSPALDTLRQKSAMLGACIARLSGNGTEAQKPARTRKSRKATESTL